MDVVIAIAAGVLGVLVGGLINVLADDLPRRQNPQPPHYPDGTPRPASAWLGITAFLTGEREAPEGALPPPHWNANSPVGDGGRPP